MNVIKPAIIVPDIDGEQILRNIEKAGRTCYKSEHRITEGSAKVFVRNLIKRGHESVLEHEKITVKIICDRGVSHQLVRHRLCSFSQESTRYCNYKDGITVIEPYFADNPEAYKVWYEACLQAEDAYQKLLALGMSPEMARMVLPTSLKTELVITANLREWRHIFKLRCDKPAHPDIKRIMIPLLLYLKSAVPVVFDDIDYDKDVPEEKYTVIWTSPQTLEREVE